MKGRLNASEDPADAIDFAANDAVDAAAKSAAQLFICSQSDASLFSRELKSATMHLVAIAKVLDLF